MTHPPYTESNANIINDPNYVSLLIRDALLSPTPCMIARFGAFEIGVINNYLSIKSAQHSVANYISGKQAQWWWNDNLLHNFSINAGFYPNHYKYIELFCKLMIEDAKEVDIIASWQNGEQALLRPDVKYIPLSLINPIKSSTPWSYYLKGKKVLVIHPFTATISKQYERRAFLFKDPHVLPNFELITLQSVQSIGGNNNEYKTWFDALEYMKERIEHINFDIALIGCGAYGFPLAAYIKRLGKKAIHIGGPLQLLFGIKGHRWDNLYGDYYNEYWTRPAQKEKPQIANKIENGCYW